MAPQRGSSNQHGGERGDLSGHYDFPLEGFKSGQSMTCASSTEYDAALSWCPPKYLHGFSGQISHRF